MVAKNATTLVAKNATTLVALSATISPGRGRRSLCLLIAASAEEVEPDRQGQSVSRWTGNSTVQVPVPTRQNEKRPGRGGSTSCEAAA